MSLAVISAIIMTVLLIVMLVMGASISIAIGLSSAVAMLCMLPVDISLITSAQRIFTGANSFSLIAIPFFILAGNLMNQAVLQNVLVDFVYGSGWESFQERFWLPMQEQTPVWSNFRFCFCSSGGSRKHGKRRRGRTGL